MVSSAEPIFKTIKSFADVPITDTGIDTSAFLEASDGLIKLFNLVQSGVFAFVQADLQKNIQGVRERFSNFPSTSSSLEDLVRTENEESGNTQATGCLLRLLRGLSFTHRALQNSRDNREEELTTSFKRAYDATLSHHHNFFVRTVVAVAIKASPRRKEFYTRIAQGESQDALDAKLEEWLIALHSILHRMSEFYQGCNYGRI